MEKFSLKWNDFHSNVSKSFQKLRKEEDFFDVTLFGDDGKHATAHKLVLASSSEYFKNIFNRSKKYFQSHALICLEGLLQEDLNNILDYIYQGEVQIHQQDLDRFLKIAQRLKLEGLTGGEQQEEEKEENYFEEDFKLAENDSLQNKNKNETNIRNIRMAEKPVITFQSSDIHSFEELDQKVEESYSKDATGNYACLHCTKSSKKISNIKEHVETHFDGLFFLCSFCDKTLRSRNALRKHKERNH